MTLDGQRLPLRSGPPSVGEHSQALMRGLGYEDAQIARLLAEGVIGTTAT